MVSHKLSPRNFSPPKMVCLWQIKDCSELIMASQKIRATQIPRIFEYVLIWKKGFFAEIIG